MEEVQLLFQEVRHILINTVSGYQMSGGLKANRRITNRSCSRRQGERSLFMKRLFIFLTTTWCI